MKSKGFTLIELMVVVVIVSVLAAIAYPSYMSYVAKSRRTDAKSALMGAAQGMERFYTEKMTYNDARLVSDNTHVAIGSESSPDNYYVIGFDTAPTSGTVCGGTSTTNGSASAFRLCATPKSPGPQASDSCGIFSLNNQGVKEPTTSGCW